MTELKTGMEPAIACQLAAVLERYETHSAEMVRTWVDMTLYAEVSALVDEIRLHCASRSGLSAPWVTFLISHSELVFCLWRSGSGPAGSCPELQACIGKHSAALHDLRLGCVGSFRAG